jgi:hypothetical protein
MQLGVRKSERDDEEVFEKIDGASRGYMLVGQVFIQASSDD